MADVWAKFFDEGVPGTVTDLRLQSVLTMAAMPERATAALARLVARLPDLTSFELSKTTIHGLDAVVHALPRKGLRYLHLGIGMREADTVDDIVRLAAAMPKLVESLEFDISCWIDRDHPEVMYGLIDKLPLATRKLPMRAESPWHGAHYPCIPLSSTLETLTVSGMYGWLNEPHLTDVLARLPPSLTILDLYYVALGGKSAALAMLARRMPPQLVTLRLAGCNLTRADLDVLAPQWPATLRELNLRFNVVLQPRNMGAARPSNLNELVKDPVHVAWTMLLPPQLRMLDLFGVPISEGMAMGMIEKMPARAPMAQMVLHAQRDWVSMKSIALLKTKFVVHVFE
ncbi:hypothetical protein AMAG_05615 [Allomyces macrogynus ATCC 38327]|uniref:F-box domain-containing protein n=1 Tax=Allomyces macrogynus (strain ATCC 38327) TaxID=578462 RepID=A0A0L0SCI4_ALLM3|nr:hypothetical protein AMAG_05615 [Allomyces macrogynus ATCC 38327]|eukprot:KNE60196.1 hypothetical protein AMAG_05615 [Allomyces macrogynus ATCC 38327]